MIGLDRVRCAILLAIGVGGSGCGPEPEDGVEGSGDDSQSSTTTDGNSSTGGESADTGKSSSSRSGSGDTGMTAIACPDPQPILQGGVEGDVPTGFVLCGNGLIHRVEKVSCQNPMPPSQGGCDQPDDKTASCVVDEDCTDRTYGVCNNNAGFVPFCDCAYGCENDSDCPEGMVCACGGDAPGYPAATTCIPADCTLDEECGTQMCGLGSVSICDVAYSLGCKQETDDCVASEDCEDFSACYPNAETHWACEPEGTCGRPFVVEGAHRRAPVVANGSWRDAPMPDTRDLRPALRQTLAAHWSEAATMEHASIASFARFSLDLLAIGAPPQLLEATQRAMADEIDHARRCFALASAYAGHDLGPGKLDVAGASSDAASFEAIIEAVFEEGCLGETLAAIEAGEAAATARDPAVAQTLRTIADDELRHAQLGWRTVRWALQRVTPAARTRLHAAFERALATASQPAAWSPASGDPAELRAHGILDARAQRATYRRALAEVIGPCTRALLEGRPDDSPHARTSHRSSMIDPVL